MSSLKTVGSSSKGRAQWRSLDQLADKPEFRQFVEREFPLYADEMLTPASRRSFLKMMGASLALAGMTACRWPQEEILPFANRPDGFTPGDAVQFATAMELGGVATGLLVTSVDGRPIKIEGNPSHPSSLGGTSAIAQASVLELYDPDRSRNVTETDGGQEFNRSWEELGAALRGLSGAARRNRGRGVRVLSEASSSPTLARMKARMSAELPEARWYEYEPVNRDSEREGTQAVLGQAARPQLSLDHAEVVVSLDEDFLLRHPAAVRYSRDFVAGRKAGGHSFASLYVVESGYTLTGAMADHRYPLAPRMIPVLAGCLAARLARDHGVALPAGLDSIVDRFAAHPHAAQIDDAMVDALAKHRGHSLILAGPRQPAEVHALVHALNSALGNVGTTVHYVAEPDGNRAGSVEAIRALAGEIGGGSVDTLLVLGGNPAFDAPADVDFAGLVANVGTTIHLSLHRNETSRLVKWHVPRAHYLESWGDTQDWAGHVSVVQPLIEPLFGGKTPIEVVSMMLGDTAPRGYDLVRETFAGSDDDWRKLLHDGVGEGRALPAVAASVRAGSWTTAMAAHAGTQETMGTGEVEVAFSSSAGLYDGRFANNGWLQEVPEPLTKLTWDNAALVGPSTAEQLGLGQGDMLRLSAGDRSIELAVYIMPGQAPGTVGLDLGYGRTTGGTVLEGAGFDVYPLRTAGAMHAVVARAEKIGGSYPLSTTQDHFAMDPLGAAEVEKRAAILAREMDLTELEHGGHGGETHGGEDHGEGHDGYHVVNLWKQWEYDGHKWGMAIDLNSCTGCNTCVVACQAENNIPVVGKDEVARGREMHWIRVDRYFSGEIDDPSVVHQPLTCHHCENAPCEQVCPVAATVHDDEGLNVMVYNRCIGTRYCANNCPYKVRRFNFFNNHKNEDPLQTMVYNPEVTVRSRGVMEKCSFCVQRINDVKIRARNDRRPIEDGEIVPACAQACPTRAISFGDLNDPESDVSDKHHDGRAYTLLEELHIKPRTRYLARLKDGAGSRGHGSGA